MLMVFSQISQTDDTGFCLVPVHNKLFEHKDHKSSEMAGYIINNNTTAAPCQWCAKFYTFIAHKAGGEIEICQNKYAAKTVSHVWGRGTFDCSNKR